MPPLPSTSDGLLETTRQRELADLDIHAATAVRDPDAARCPRFTGGQKAPA